MSISDQELEYRLRDQRTRVDYVAPPANNLAELTRERHRTLRRREIGLAGAVLAAALVFVGVPVVASTLADSDQGQAAHPSSRTGITDTEALYDAPPRGGLADDQDWVDALAARPWNATNSDQRDPGMEFSPAPVDTHRVAYADDVPSGRVALVVGISGQELVHTWWVGPAGATPDQMTLADYPALIGGGVMALVDGSPDATTLTLVVVAEPGALLHRERVPVVDAHGRQVAQGSEGLSLTDGIAVVPVDRRWAQAEPTVYLDLEDGGVGLPVSQSPRAALAGPSDVAAADPRGQAVGYPYRWLLDASIGRLLRQYGLTVAESHPTILAGADLGAALAAELVGVTFPSGATGMWLTTYTPGHPDAGTTVVELPFQPAGTPLLDQVVGVRSPAGFLVSAPSGVRADVLDADGALLGSVALTNGAGGGTLPQPYDARTVRVVDAAGDVVGEAQVQDAG